MSDCVSLSPKEGGRRSRLGSPSKFATAQPVYITILCPVAGWTRSGALGAFSVAGPTSCNSTGSSPWSNTEFWQFSRKLLETRNCLRVIKHTKRSRDASLFCATKTHDWHWHRHWHCTVFIGSGTKTYRPRCKLNINLITEDFVATLQQAFCTATQRHISAINIAL